MSQHPMRMVVVVSALLVALNACALADVGVACVDDSGCAEGFVCALGQCADPNVGDLGPVDLQVEPGPGANLPVQALLGVAPSNDGRLSLTLQAGVTLAGRVLRNDVGVAAQIVARPTRSIAGRALAVSTTSDASGGFSLVGVQGERYALSVTPTDPTLAPFYDDVGVRADPGANGVREIRPYNLAAQATVVTGRVVAGTGASRQGIPGMEVSLREGVAGRPGRLASSVAHTAGDGTFSLALEAAATGLVLQVRPTDENAYFPSLDLPGVDVVADTALGDVELGEVLSPGAMAVLVLDDDGAPAGAAVVTLEGTVGNGSFGTHGTTNADGRVTLDAPPGRYRIVVLGPDNRAAGLSVVNDVEVPLQAPLTIQLAPRARLSGRVVDPLLGPVPASGLAFVRVGDEDGNPEPALADVFVGGAAVASEEGDFSVDLPPGRYRTNITPPLSSGAPAVSVLLTLGAAGLDADIDLPTRAILAGTLLFDGQAVQDAYVRVFGAAQNETGAALQLGDGQAGPDGKFEIVVAADGAVE